MKKNTNIGFPNSTYIGSHGLTDSPAGVRSGDRRCSYNGCEGNEFDSYKDHPLCEYHYNEHLYLQKQFGIISHY